MRLEISELHHQLKTTMIYVTHDQVEAMTMADKIVVLNAGNIEQVGSPLELYQTPKNLFVAGFIGSPRMNLIEGAPAAKHGATTIGIRPEHMNDLDDGRRLERHGRRCRASRLRHLPACAGRRRRQDHRARRWRFRRPLRHTIYLTPDQAKLHRFGADGKAM